MRTRLTNHLSKYKFVKFHIISRNLGWDNFSLSVIEINNYSNLIERENYYLFYYKPFKSLGETGAFLSTSSATIFYYLDNLKIY